LIFNRLDRIEHDRGHHHHPRPPAEGLVVHGLMDALGEVADVRQAVFDQSFFGRPLGMLVPSTAVNISGKGSGCQYAATYVIRRPADPRLRSGFVLQLRCATKRRPLGRRLQERKLRGGDGAFLFLTLRRRRWIAALGLPAWAA
jgi:hypothetical protein